MKMIFLAAAIAVSVASCTENDSKKTDNIDVTTVAKEATKNGTAETVELNDVPDSINTSFMIKYPGATKVVWKKYEPQDEDDLPRDKTYYYTSYYNNGANYTSWYNNDGLWVRTFTDVSGPKELPDAVNKTINAKFPGYSIKKIEKEEDDGQTEYEVKLIKGELKAKLKLSPTGVIIKQKLKD